MNPLALAMLERETGPGARLAYGEVATVSPLTVTVGGSTTAAAATSLAGYGPTVGDYVAVLINGADRLVIGRVGTGTDSYEPTLTGAAVGTGGGASNTASYSRVGQILHVDGVILFGTSGATLPTGAIDVSLPAGYSLLAASFNYAFGRVHWIDANGSDFLGSCGPGNVDTDVRLFVDNAAGTYLARSNPSATIPFTWAVSDAILYQYSVRVE